MVSRSAGALDHPEVLHELLGSFWAGTYGGRTEVASFVAACAEALRQAQDDLDSSRGGRALTTAARTPRRHRFQQVTLLQSELARERTLKIGGFTLGDGSVLGGSVPADARWRWQVPGRPAPLLMDRPAEPARVLVRGVDFAWDETTGVLELAEDPFAEPALAAAVELIRDAAGVVVDRRLALWAYGAAEPAAELYPRYGVVLAADGGGSDPAYPELIQAAWDAVVGGASLAALEAVLAAAADIPLATQDGVVEDLWRESDGALCVLTDTRFYRYGPGALPLVAIGQHITAGQPLCDGLLIAQPRGQPPAWLRQLALGSGLLAPGLRDVIFVDQEVPWVVTAQPSGAVHLACTLGGDPEASAGFWAEVHRRGVAAGKTLAQYLDRRGDAADTPPTAAELPSTVNPLRFVCEHWMRQNLVLVRLKRSACGPAAQLQRLRLARLALPPQVALILVLEAAAPPARSGGGGRTSSAFLAVLNASARSSVGGRSHVTFKTRSC